MTRIILAVGTALLLACLSACGKKDAPGAPTEASATGEEASPSAIATAPSDPSPLADPAAQPIEGDAASAWVELMGAWAENGRCADDTERWVIDAESFSLYEMHCAAGKLELLQNGVKATGKCVVEGYEDPDDHTFWFLRQGDGSLTIVQGDNNAMTTGLFPCEEGVEL
jgi:hypothetical protein